MRLQTLSLRLEDIQRSSYLSPENLVVRISCMRELENLSFSFVPHSTSLDVVDMEWELITGYACRAH